MGMHICDNYDAFLLMYLDKDNNQDDTRATFCILQSSPSNIFSNYPIVILNIAVATLNGVLCNSRDFYIRVPITGTILSELVL